MEKKNIKELNSKIPNLRTLYDILTDNKCYYLPSFESKACSFEYLMKIIKDEKTFKIKRNFITKPPILKQRKTVEELKEIIEEKLKSKGLSLGFEDNYPEKKWLIDILFYLEPKHPIFTIEEEIIVRDFPEK